MTPQHRAWTGGSPPPPWPDTPDAQRRYAVRLYRDQCREWRAFWGDSPDADTARIFWGRAIHDAHATYREEE